jgi:hypothetical protein
MSTAKNSSDNSKKAVQEPPIPPRPIIGNERMESVDSSAFSQGDDYEDYDDFGIGQSGGGGGGTRTKSQKIQFRQDTRGGGGGSDTIYSAKHVRAKEALQLKGKKT